MRIPTITADVPTEFPGSHWSRHTNVDGRTYRAAATEFGDLNGPCDRISLTIHPRGEWALPEENRPFADHAFGIHGNVVSGTVSIDIGDVSVYLPEGHEQRVLNALLAALAEQARQADAGEDTCVVNLTEVAA
jgi:hypothetical protein|tara:strand:- start:197 stop:595 length:399 start_codon:yes stop_codon:yes gene_type:complete